MSGLYSVFQNAFAGFLNGVSGQTDDEDGAPSAGQAMQGLQGISQNSSGVPRVYQQTAYSFGQDYGPAHPFAGQHLTPGTRYVPVVFKASQQPTYFNRETRDESRPISPQTLQTLFKDGRLGKAGSVDDWTSSELERLYNADHVFKTIFSEQPDLADVFSQYLSGIPHQRRQFSLAKLAPALISNTEHDRKTMFDFVRFVIPPPVYAAFTADYGDLRALFTAMSEQATDVTGRNVSANEMVIPLRVNMMFEIMLRVALTPDRKINQLNEDNFRNFTSNYIAECKKNGTDPFPEYEIPIRGKFTYRQVGVMISKFPLATYMFTSTFRESCERMVSNLNGDGQHRTLEV